MVEFKPHPLVALPLAAPKEGQIETYRNDYEQVFTDIANGYVRERDVYRALVLDDLFFIVYFVMGIEKANHPFVVKVCNMVSDGPKTDTLDIWSRFHFKSTILTIAETIQFSVANPEKCTGIFAYSRPAAKKFLRGIKILLEQNELLKSCFPDVLWNVPDRESPKWSEDDGLVLKRKSASRGESNIEAWGLTEGMPTGRHFERCVFDDLETEDIRDSPDMLNKVYSKFEMAGNLGTGSDTDIVRVIGTYYSHYGPNIRVRDMKYEDGRQVYQLRLIPGSDNGQRDGNPVLMDPNTWEKLKTSTHFNCVPSGTKISTINGERDIEDISEGDMVLTHKGRYRMVLKKFIHTDFDGSLLQFNTWASNQNDLLVTDGHPIYSLKKQWRCKKDKATGNRAKDRVQYASDFDFIPAEDVKQADCLLSPIIHAPLGESEILSHIPVTNPNAKPFCDDYILRKSFWRFVGYWLAEGFYYRSQSNTRFVLCFSQYNDTEIKRDCRDTLKSLLNRSVSTVIIQGGEQLIFCSVELGEFFKEFGCGSLNKRIPAWVERLPVDLLSELYKGYLAGDGCIDKKGYEVITSINVDMLQSFQRILGSLGRISSIAAPYQKRNNIINGKRRNCKPFYRLIVTDKAKMTWFESGGIAKKIKDINRILYTGPVYNIEVDQDNSYVANSYAVHNSQQLCDPTPSTDVKLDFSLLKPIEPRLIPRNLFKFMVIDQAGGGEDKTTSKDMWSYGVIGVEPCIDEIGQSKCYLLDLEAEKMSHSEGIDGIVRMYTSNGVIHQIGVEKTGLATTEIHITNALRARGRRVSVEAKNLVLLRPAGRTKVFRVESALQWPLNNGMLYYSTDIHEHYIQYIKDEMNKYPYYHCDILDMWAYVYDMVKHYHFLREDDRDLDNVVNIEMYGQSAITGY